MRLLRAFLTAIAVSVVPSFLLLASSAQVAKLVGRWRVEFSIYDTEKHTLQFDADASGDGTYLLLDSRSSLLPPAEPSKAGWKLVASNRVTISGEIEFPIGNVGRNAGTLTFKGVFDSPGLISGEVAFFSQGQDPRDPSTVPAGKGRFTARRMDAARAKVAPGLPDDRE